MKIRIDCNIYLNNNKLIVFKLTFVNLHLFLSKVEFLVENTKTQVNFRKENTVYLRNSILLIRNATFIGNSRH